MRRTWHKFKAVRTQRDGRSFASKLEAALYELLKLLEAGSIISELRCQPHVFLTEARIEMIPDFSALDSKVNEVVYYEAKGFETSDWRIKRKLWTVYGPGPLKIYKGTHKMLKLVEEITPKTYHK